MSQILRLGLVLVVTSSACNWISEELRRPTRHYLPEDYLGWVTISYEVEGAPPLEIDDGRFIATIPASGRLETSSELDFGTPLAGHDEFRYRESGTTLKPWPTSQREVGILAPANGDASESFFVGNELQYREFEIARDHYCEGLRPKRCESYLPGALDPTSLAEGRLQFLGPPARLAHR